MCSIQRARSARSLQLFTGYHLCHRPVYFDERKNRGFVDWWTDDGNGSDDGGDDGDGDDGGDDD